MRYHPESMSRGRGQALYRYRPDQTFDHKDHFIARVVDYRPDESYGRQFDKTYLIGEGARFVERWRRAGRNGADLAPTFPADGPLAATAYDVVVPGSVSFRFWPLVVTCGSPECRRVYVLSGEPDVGEWVERCPTCGHAPSYQLQYVFTHECGFVDQFMPPPRCSKGHDAFRLYTKASRFRDFQWICIGCGEARALMAFCQNVNCSRQNKMMHPEVHTSSSAYVAQGRSVAYPPDPGYMATTQLPAFKIAVVGRWLGLCSEEVKSKLISGERPQDVSINRELLEALREVNPGKAAEMEARAAAVDLVGLRRQIGERLGDAVAQSDQELQELAAQLEAYERIRARGTVSLADLRSGAVSEARRALYNGYPLTLRRAGFDPENVFLVPDFPLIYLAVGYSRGGYSSQDRVDLVAYKGRVGRTSAQKTLLFAHPQRTEAIMFGLDEHRVSRWLVSNGLTDEATLGTAGGLRLWFASYLARRGDITWLSFEQDENTEDRAGNAVIRLLHGMSHQILRSLSVGSGFMETSLSEHFFPNHLSFAIYPRANSEFVIGGLRTVLEQALDDIVVDALDNDQCIYDPNCYYDRGADHGCLFLPETSCVLWNRMLSRWDLFGGGPEGRVGYWDPRFQ